LRSKRQHKIAELLAERTGLQGQLVELGQMYRDSVSDRNRLVSELDSLKEAVGTIAFLKQQLGELESMKQQMKAFVLFAAKLMQ
jgi:DNA repair exonuclease SbcCD ATPase subunit